MGYRFTERNKYFLRNNVYKQDMNPTDALILTATITFSPFAAIIAYIITYDEYSHHFDKKRAMGQAFQAAIFTFIVFVVMGILSGYVFNTFINQG